MVTKIALTLEEGKPTQVRVTTRKVHHTQDLSAKLGGRSDPAEVIRLIEALLVKAEGNDGES
jgi:predicted Zn-dependent protease